MKTKLLLPLSACIAAFSSCADHGTPDQQVRVTAKIVSHEGTRDLPSVMMRNIDQALIELKTNRDQPTGIVASYKTSQNEGDVAFSGYFKVGEDKKDFGETPADGKTRIVVFNETTRVIVGATRVDATGAKLKLSEQVAAPDS
ncbi:hypothetical protein HW115_18895 [Verrucomicrobiaceae bacterium N1E253]|uniref:Lipoprotein n=1 Tax=Oceaniferula marina TaxID=2748318 RepID=A0A851GJJ8_9BACT|nr:hypothetical protein [Oceaniferula marina]NWK57693.1 hypothetical protein [Oceaniferula marina]